MRTPIHSITKSDPFSERPLKLTRRAGKLIVYSVGKDGRDDCGLKDADLGRNPSGDYIFAMPYIKMSR